MIQGLTLSAGFRSGTAKLLRFAAAGLMLATTFGPFPDAARPVAEAKNREWGDVRPPLTDDNDSTESDGFTALPTFGSVFHALAVAPNGDVFAAGSTGASWSIFRSSNGGKNWRTASTPNVPAASIIRQIVVSPDYPSDGWVGFVYSDDTAADSGTDNGFCWATTFPTGAGASFGTTNCLDTLDGGIFADINMRTIALSPDFNWQDGVGELAVGGNQEAGPGSVAIALVGALKTGGHSVADFLLATDPDGDVTDVTGHLAYNNDLDPISLARLWLNVAATGDGPGGNGTYGQILSGGAWPTATIAARLSTTLADAGQVAFDDEYSAGGSYWAAISLTGAPVGGVFRFDGAAWTNKTSVDDACNADINSFMVTGNGSTTRIVASLPGSSTVCRSSNEGSSWSDNETDGGNDVCNACVVNPIGAFTLVASNRVDPTTVYYTSSATLGGVFRSTSAGSNWSDTGLTNLAYTVTSVRELDASKAFANVAASGGVDAIFYTDNYGTGAGWVRVLRTERTDLSFGPGLGDIGTSGKTFARFSNTGAVTDKILVTADGGLTWDDAIAPNPFAGIDLNENAFAESVRDGNTAYFGGDRGHVAFTTDGGASWTVLAKDFGDDIDEFDFTTDPLVFFVTAEDSDNINKVWRTADGGATFTQAFGTPWGTGDGGISVDISGYNAAANTGTIMVMTNGSTSTDEVYRVTMPAGTIEDLDLDTEWTDAGTFPLAASPDGRGMYLWRSSTGCGAGEGQFVYISRPFTGNKDEMTPPGCSTGATTDPVLNDPAGNVILQLPNPPLTFGGVVSFAQTLPGFTFQFVAGNRIMELTMPADFTAGLTPVSPINGISVPSNTGAEGVPAILRWNGVATTDRYLVRVGLLPELQDATVLGCPTSVPDAGGGACAAGDSAITAPQAIVDQVRYALIPGQTYYWDVQEIVAENRVLQGPRSPIASFVVTMSGGGALGGTNLKISTGKPTANAIDLAWDAGDPPGGFRIHRTDFFTSTTVLLPPGGPLPGNATSYFDTSAAATTLYCYFVTPLSATGDPIAASDTECAMTGVKNGTVVPADFTLSLGQSTTTTLGWKAPAGGADNFLLVVLPLDGGASSSVALNGVTRGISREEATTGPTCYIAAGIKGAVVGNTDLLCSIPGLSTFADESGLVVSPATAPGQRPGQGALHERIREHILQWRSAENRDAASLLRMIGRALGPNQGGGRGGR